MSLEVNNHHEVLPEDIRNFKTIIHQLFNQSNKKLSIKKIMEILSIKPKFQKKESYL